MKRKKAGALFLGLAVAFTSVPVSVFAETEKSEPMIVNLKTEGMVNPLGMDEAEPSFSWQMHSDAIGAAQKSYQIVVTDDMDAVVWDSGVVESSASNEIKYGGETLKPVTAYSWKVTVTDHEGNTLESEPATFETAFMDTTKESWDGAQMIGAPDLQLDAASQCAFNISASVQIPEGSSSASFILGADDFRLKNAVFNTESMAGENYVRIELDISDVEGTGAQINAYRMGYTAEDQADTPVHVIRTNEVVEALGETKEGSDAYIYDMGENVSGVPVITIPEEYAKPGETMTVRFAEILYPEMEEYTEKGIDGTLMVENYRAAMVTDFYTMKEGENVFAPDLTFHGYRYIEISGLGAELPAECIQMQVLSSLDATGTYESSNELTNQLYKNIVNSTTSNYISIPTDCPQRNERMGWTGDAQIFALTGSYVADTYNFLDVWMDSVRADCGETGMSAQFTPAYIQYAPEDEAIEHKGQSFGITWNSLVVTIPYNLYMQTGRKEILEENKDNIYAYVDTLASTPLTYKNEEGEKLEEPRLTGEVGMLADHLARVVTDSTLLGNVLYINCLNQAAEIADIMGDTDKAESYRDTSETAKEAWNEMFIDPEMGKTKNTKGEIQDTQASYATPLRFDVISDENKEKVLANYKASIAEASGEDTEGNAIVPYTLTTGFNATGNLLNALSDNGLNEMAYQLFEATDYASWLYPVTQGATSIWERWNSYTEEKAFGGNNSMNSFNHYSFGAVGEWMMGYQLGIKADKEQPGYQHFILQPTVGGSFTEVKGSYESVYAV